MSNEVLELMKQMSQAINPFASQPNTNPFGVFPGMVVPPMSLEELDKNLANLKAVENWMQNSLNLLRMNITTLETQRSMIANMQQISASMAQAMAPGQTSPFSADTYSQPTQGTDRKTDDQRRRKETGR